MARGLLSSYVGSRYVEVENISGNLAQGLIFNNVNIKNLKKLPLGTTISVRCLHLACEGIGLKGFQLNIENGKFSLPGSDPILFYGKYKQDSLDVTVYSNYVAVQEIFDLFVESEILKNILGNVTGLDIKILGSLFTPKLSGHLYVNKLKRRGFSLQECPVLFDITLKDLKRNIQVSGDVILSQGKVASRHTSVDLHRSKILFSGNPKTPKFKANGTSFIDGVKIDILFNGTVKNPELVLTSEPSMADEILMLMLATGKRWRSAERVLYQGKMSPEVISDFVDYFIFGGTGSKLGKLIGVKDISVTIEEEKRGVEIIQGVSSKAQISYGIEQSTQENQELPVITQSVGVGYNITETQSVSIQAERETTPGQENEEKEQTKTDEKVMLKFKKRF